MARRFERVTRATRATRATTAVSQDGRLVSDGVLAVYAFSYPDEVVVAACAPLTRNCLVSKVAIHAFRASVKFVFMSAPTAVTILSILTFMPGSMAADPVDMVYE